MDVLGAKTKTPLQATIIDEMTKAVSLKYFLQKKEHALSQTAQRNKMLCGKSAFWQ